MWLLVDEEGAALGPEVLDMDGVVRMDLTGTAR
jgi:hypothetical protein